MTVPCRAAAAFIVLLASTATPARAAESYDNCTGFITQPMVITTQGVWCLTGDLDVAVGDGIRIAANNVTVDCNHFTLDGSGAGLDTDGYGIWNTLAYKNIAIRRCNVRGFQIGIYARGDGYVIEDNSIDRSTHAGIDIAGTRSTVRRNLVSNTGGSTWVFDRTYGIYTSGGIDVLDNTLGGVGVDGENANAIVNDGPTGATIAGNRIFKPAPFSAIWVGVGDAIVEGNYLMTPGDINNAIYCAPGATVTVTRNVIVGYPSATSPSCYAVDNLVNN